MPVSGTVLTEIPRQRSPAVICFLTFSMAAFVYAQYGFEGAITRDTANALYSGQQMARGVPHGVSIFNHSGVLGPLISGVGAWLATGFHLDDVLTVRLLFFILGCLVAAALYPLGAMLFDSRQAGILAACVFVGFSCFGKHAVAGPAIKVPMVLLEVLSLLLMVRKRWFSAAVCGSLAFLAWQPTAIYAVAAILLAYTQSAPGQERTRNVIRAVSGALIPVLGVSFYFLWKGAFYEFLDGTVLFNLYHLEREPSSVASHLLRPIKTIFDSYTFMALPIFLGFLALVAIYVWRLNLYGRRIGRLISEDKFAAVLLTFPAPVIWSVLDFQGCPDFYVFLPYVALGFGWVTHLGLQQAVGIIGLAPSARRWSFLTLCATLIAASAVYYKNVAETGLREQRQWARQLESRFGRDVKLVSIGVPEILVLLHRANPTPYVFIVSGIDNRIHARTEGGFDGWLKELEASDPQVIAFGQTSGRFQTKLTDWLQAGYQETAVGEWKLFVKKSPAVSPVAQ